MDLSKDVPRIGLVALGSLLFVVGMLHPDILSDKNEFLKSFTSDYVLSVIGLILSVTLASCTNIHFRLNEIENSSGRSFPETKKLIKKSAYSLIFLFGFAFACLFIKSVWIDVEWMQVICNSIMISILFFYGAVISDITATVFAIPSA